MADANKRALPPVPLPAGIEPPRVAFEDIARSAGLHSPAAGAGPANMTYLPETTGPGIALFDFDGDDRLDIFVVGRGGFEPGAPQPNLLYRNLGGLRFENVSAEAGLGASGWGQGACAGDVDGDGHADLLVTHWGQDVLLRNLAGARFRDETEQRGLASGPARWSTGCGFLDFDRDGDLDLFVAHYVEFDLDSTPLPGDAPQCAWKGVPIPCGPRGLAGESMALYANDGSGSFRDVTEAAGVATAKRHHGLGVLTADFDGDGWPDVYVACDSTASLLFRNRQDGTFAESALLSGVAYNEDGQEQAGMGVAVADYDGDGLLDIFKTNFTADTNTLYGNRDGGRFRDRTIAAGLATVTRFVGWGTEFLDFDRDGWPDLFAANGHVAPNVDGAALGETFAQPALLFWNRGDGVFHYLGAAAGPGPARPRPSRGVAVGDLDNDGDQEIVVANLDGPPSLLVNEVPAEGNWLSVRALLRSGADAVGARIAVTAGGRTQISEVRSGGSYLSQSDFRLHFGLGGETEATIEIRWPSGARTEVGRRSANRFVVVREGSEHPR